MRASNVTVISAADTANANGLQIDASQLIQASFHAHFGDATAVGTFKIQASNDLYDTRYLSSDFTVVNWVDIPNASVAVTAGVPALILLPTMAYRWVRAVWDYTSGGSTTIIVNMVGMSV